MSARVDRLQRREAKRILGERANSVVGQVRNETQVHAQWITQFESYTIPERVTTLEAENERLRRALLETLEGQGKTERRLRNEMFDLRNGLERQFTSDLRALRDRGFFGRLNWLLRGK